MSGPFTSADVPYPFDVIVDGFGFRLYDALETLPYGLPRATYGMTPTFLPRTNVSGDYGDNQQDFWLVFSQRDWSLGEGQRYFRQSDDESVRRFWRGQKVNIAVPGEVSLAQDLATITAAASVRAVASGRDYFYYATASNLYRVANDGTVTDHGAHGQGGTIQPYGLVADPTGDVYIAGTGANVIRKYDGAFSNFGASTDHGSLAYLNNALYAGRNGRLYRFDTAGVRTTVFTWQAADGNNINEDPLISPLGGSLAIVLQNGLSGGAELWLYDGTAPALATTFPQNFQAYDLASMYGISFVAGRFQRSRGATKEYLPAVYFYASGTPGLLWAADDWSTQDGGTVCDQFQNQLVFIDVTRTTLMAYNLDTGGVHTKCVYTGGTGTSSMGASWFQLGWAPSIGTTVNRFPASGYPSSAQVDTSLFDADNSGTKRFKSVKLDFDLATDGDGGSVDIAYRLNDLNGSYTALQTGAVAGTEYSLNQTGRSIGLRITLNKGTSTKGPVLKRIYVRGSPILDSYRRGQYVLDLTGRDGDGMIVLRDGRTHTKDGKEMADDLFATARLGAPVTITDRFGSFTGIIDTEGFEVMELHPEVFAAVVRVRET